MTTTSNIKLSTPSHGSNTGTWDADPVNNNSGILDTCFGSVTTKNLSGASGTNVTLTTTEAQSSIIRLTGTITANTGVVVSAVVKSWIFENLVNMGTFGVFVVGSGGNNISLPPGSCQGYWDGTNMSFINLSPQVGGFWDYIGSSVPNWVLSSSVPPFLNCDGSVFDGAVYPLLARILSGVTLPDTRGRARFALNQGTARIGASSGIDGNSNLVGGGIDTVTLNTSQMPAHNHIGTTDNGGVDHSHPYNQPSSPVALAQFVGGGALVVQGAAGANTSGASQFIHTHTFTTNSAGSSGAHTNMPPAFIGGITLIRAG